MNKKYYTNILSFLEEQMDPENPVAGAGGGGSSKGKKKDDKEKPGVDKPTEAGMMSVTTPPTEDGIKTRQTTAGVDPKTGLPQPAQTIPPNVGVSQVPPEQLAQSLLSQPPKEKSKPASEPDNRIFGPEGSFRTGLDTAIAADAGYFLGDVASKGTQKAANITGKVAARVAPEAAPAIVAGGAAAAEAIKGTVPKVVQGAAKTVSTNAARLGLGRAIPMLTGPWGLSVVGADLAAQYVIPKIVQDLMGRGQVHPRHPEAHLHHSYEYKDPIKDPEKFYSRGGPGK